MKLPYLRYYKTDTMYHGMISYWDKEEETETQVFARYPTLEEVVQVLTDDEWVPTGKLKRIKSRINGPTQHDIEVHLDRGDGKAKPLDPKEERRFLSILGLK